MNKQTFKLSEIITIWCKNPTYIVYGELDQNKVLFNLEAIEKQDKKFLDCYKTMNQKFFEDEKKSDASKTVFSCESENIEIWYVK